MRRVIAGLTVLLAASGWAEEGYDLTVAGQPWLHTVTTPYDDSKGSARAKTYKVFTQIYDFGGDGYLTKGQGGLYPHHRGLFIGWMKTELDEPEVTVDTWHMRGCYQEHVEWLERLNGDDTSRQSQIVEWRLNDGTAFIRERRTIVASENDAGQRILDFTSELQALDTAIRLRGDLQHAGMQVRLANEVAQHQDTTEYILPDGAERLEGDEIHGASWACCSAVIEGKRYWIVHMTRNEKATAQPVYSIRAYGRFGAFFEPDIAAGESKTLEFRILVSDRELSREECQALYDSFASR